jgi:hypothetical protein
MRKMFKVELPKTATDTYHNKVKAEHESEYMDVTTTFGRGVLYVVAPCIEWVTKRFPDALLVTELGFGYVVEDVTYHAVE